MRPTFEVLESIDTIEEFQSKDDELWLHVKGWNHPETVKDFIAEEFREWHGEDEITIAIINKEEKAFSCSRHCEREVTNFLQ